MIGTHSAISVVRSCDACLFLSVYILADYNHSVGEEVCLLRVDL